MQFQTLVCNKKSKKPNYGESVEDVKLIMIPLQLMDKWMMQHRSWYEFVIGTYRSRFEEVLDVIDSITFRAKNERLEFYLKDIEMLVIVMV